MDAAKGAEEVIIPTSPAKEQTLCSKEQVSPRTRGNVRIGRLDGYQMHLGAISCEYSRIGQI